MQLDPQARRQELSQSCSAQCFPKARRPRWSSACGTLTGLPLAGRSEPSLSRPSLLLAAKAESQYGKRRYIQTDW